MPIPAEFAIYQDESAFRSRFLVPLLSRLGNTVIENHGTREFGRDIIFASIDCFGHVNYSGLQAKFQASVSQSDSHGLVEDCNEAFGVPFRHPQTGIEERIGKFYAVNGGSIADNARSYFFESLRPRYGSNIVLLDGPALIALDRSIAFNRLDTIVSQLTGIQSELGYNSLILNGINAMIDSYAQAGSGSLPIERLSNDAVSAFTSRPILMSKISYDVILQYRHAVVSFNRTLDMVQNGIIPSDNRLQLAKRVLVLRDNVNQLATTLLPQIRGALASTGGPLASV